MSDPTQTPEALAAAAAALAAAGAAPGTPATGTDPAAPVATTADATDPQYTVKLDADGTVAGFGTTDATGAALSMETVAASRPSMTDVVEAAASDAFKAGDATKHSLFAALHMKLNELRQHVLTIEHDADDDVSDVIASLKANL